MLQTKELHLLQAISDRDKDVKKHIHEIIIQLTNCIEKLHA